VACQSGPTAQGSLACVRPDMRIVVADDFEKLADRLDGTLRMPRLPRLRGRRGRVEATSSWSLLAPPSVIG
jgi:hypothetical protein